MKKIYLLLSMFVSLAGTAYADITYPYLVDFNTSIDVSSTKFVVADDWSHKESSMDKNANGDQVYAEYAWNATGGVDNSGYLEAKTQYVKTYDWNYGYQYDYLEDMLVTPAIKGTSSIYLKKTSDKQSFFTVYKLVQNKWGSWLKSGKALYTVTAQELGDDWQKVELPEVEEGTFLGLYASNMAMDNFEASGETSPAVGKLAVYSASGNTAWSADGAWDFGAVASLDAAVTLKNEGDADLNVTSVTATAPFTAALAAEGAIAPGATQKVNIGIDATEKGLHEGTLTISTDGGDFTLNISAYTYDAADTWVQTFEGGKVLPAGMTREDGWTFDTKGDAFATDADQYVAHANTRAEVKLTTPLLQFAEGDKFVLQLARTTSIDTDPINIYYSTDRKAWTLAATIAASDLPLTKQNYSYTYKTFAVDGIPAGQYYVAIGSSACYLDNIVGGKAVEVAHDWTLSKPVLPVAGTVNNALAFSATLTNNNVKAEDAGTYTATLLVNGEEAATAESTALAAGETATYTFAYTPHAAGTATAQIVFEASDGYKVATDEVSVDVAAETAVNEIVTGEPGKLINGLPAHIYNNNSEGVMLYTPAKLAGLKKGDKISKIVFKGYGANYKNENYASHLTVWIANTEDVAQKSPEVQPLDTASMAKVYDDTYTWPIAGESAIGKTADILTLTFAEPFVYDGNSIRIVVKNTGDYYRNVKFEMENEDEGLGYIKTADDKAFETAAYKSSSLPVAHIIAVGEPKVLTGKVTDNEELPVAGAKITLKSGDVEYYATTAEDGTYSMDVIQYTLDFQATAVADEFSATANVTFGDEATKTLDFVLPYATGISTVTPAWQKGAAEVYTVSGMCLGKRDVKALKPGLYIVGGKKVMVK